MKSVHEILQMEWKDQAGHLKGMNLKELEGLNQLYREYEVNCSRLGLAILSVIRDLREDAMSEICKHQKAEDG